MLFIISSPAEEIPVGLHQEHFEGFEGLYASLAGLFLSVAAVIYLAAASERYHGRDKYVVLAVCLEGLKRSVVVPVYGQYGVCAAEIYSEIH